MGDRNTKNSIVAISQPSFLPWLGYISIIDAADDFVFLDDVAFSRQSWQQRNRLRGPSGLQWLTVPVKSASRSGQLISETEIDVSLGFPKKHVTTLSQLYGKSPNWKVVGEPIISIFHEAIDHKSLSKLNCSLITFITNWLGIDTRLHLSSQLESELGRTEKLSSLAEGLGASVYLSAPGSEEYLRSEKGSFDRRKIGIELHQFEHPKYQQRFSPFLSHASVVDLIFSESDDPLKILRSGRQDPMKISFFD